MPKSTALAHANLAFVKYWGKQDSTLNIPLNNSISMNLSAAQTTTTVVFDDSLSADAITVDGSAPDDRFTTRVSAHLDRLRLLAGVDHRAKVATGNSFPTSAGFASSASGFAALTLAAASAFDLDLSERELSVLSRQGSGSACRSIPGGFAEWHAGTFNDDSFADQLAPAHHWDIADVAVVVTTSAKDVSSSQGHLIAPESPFWPARVERLPTRLDQVRRAILERDFATFGQEIEAEAMSMHAIMMTSAHNTDSGWRSGIYYWSPGTLELLIAVQRWRADGLPVYFTLDAGPTVHLICPITHEQVIVDAVNTIRVHRDWTVIISHPATGAQLIDKHRF